MRRRLAGILGGIVIAGVVVEGPDPHALRPTADRDDRCWRGVGQFQTERRSTSPCKRALQLRAPRRRTTARRAKAVMDTLRLIGIAGDQVQTANYNVSPEMAYPTTQSQAPRTVAYTVTNSLLLKLKRIDDVARAIDAALAKGANEISSLQFSSSTADSVRSVALAAAVADAKIQAEAMARAAGGSLGQLLELSTSRFRCAQCRWCKHSRRGRRSRHRSRRESSRSVQP